MNNIIKKIFYLLFWIFIFLLLVNNGNRYLDADFGWHLKVGENIVTKGEIPDLEYFDYTLEGQHWVDHEWGANYLSYVIYRNFGYFSLVVFFALIATFSFYLLYLFIYKKYKAKIESNILLRILLFGFILLGVYASFPHLGVRMQEFTLLFLVFLMYILEYFSKTKKYIFLFLLIPLFIFWANIHAGFLIGLFLLFSWISLKVVELFLHKYKKISVIEYSNIFSLREVFITVGFTLLALLATILNPYGIKLYYFLTSYSNDYYLKHIVEWLPFYYLPVLYKQLAYTALSLAVVIIFIGFSFVNDNKYWKKNIKVSLWDIFVFGLFLYLALKSKRHFPLFFILTLPIVFNFYQTLFGEIFVELKKIINLKIVAFFLISVLFILVISQLIKVDFSKEPFNDFCDSFPCGAVQFIKNDNNLQEKRVLNDYSWGGFLIWTLPEMKLFIDGRLPQFYYNGHSLLEEYNDFLSEDLVADKIKEQDIEMVLMRSKKKEIKLNFFEKYFLMLDENKINDNKNYLKEYLEDNDSWNAVYNDDVSIIYVKI